jgi:CBS domain-containing protein
MNVDELMTKNPACVTPADTARDAARAMEENDCGALPVVESENEKRLIGMITDRDIAIRGVAKGKGPDTLVRDLMTDGPDAARIGDDMKTVKQIMTRNQVRRVPIIDADNRLVGIIAQADLARNDEAASDERVGEVVEKISKPSR